MIKRIVIVAATVVGIMILFVSIKYFYHEVKGEKDITEESFRGDTVKTYHMSKIDGEWLRNGECEFTDGKGNLLRRGQYRLGKKEGEWLFYEGVHVRVSAQYANDERNGNYVIFYDNGKQKVHGQCLNDREQGLWTVLFPGGSVLSLTHYSNGLKQGQYREFFENKSVSISGYFKDNAYDSVWTVMNPLGYAAERRTYEHNELIRFESLRPNGTPVHIIAYDQEGKTTSDQYVDEFGKDMITHFFGSYRDLSAKKEFSADWIVNREHGELIISPPNRYVHRRYSFTQLQKVTSELTYNERGIVEATADSIILHPEERRNYPSRYFMAAVENRTWIENSDREWASGEQWDFKGHHYSLEEFRDIYRSGPVAPDEQLQLPSNKKTVEDILNRAPLR